MKDSMKELIHNGYVLQGLPEPPNNYTYETRIHNRTLLVSGCIVIIGLCTMVVLPFILSGDSTTQRQSSIIPQSIHQNQVM